MIAGTYCITLERSCRLNQEIAIGDLQSRKLNKCYTAVLLVASQTQLTSKYKLYYTVAKKLQKRSLPHYFSFTLSHLTLLLSSKSHIHTSLHYISPKKITIIWSPPISSTTTCRSVTCSSNVIPLYLTCFLTHNTYTVGKVL